MRIAFLVRAFPTVSETFVRDQIEGLRRRGHSVDVYSLYAGAQASASGATRPAEATDARYLIGPELPLPRALLRAAGRCVLGLGSPGPAIRLAGVALRHPRIAAEAIHAVPKLRSGTDASGGAYDVVHAHYGPTGTLALALRRADLLGGPLVTTFHGIDLSRYPARQGPDCYRWLFREGEAFTVNSNFAESKALDLGAPRDRLHRLPVGIDTGDIPFRVRSYAAPGPLRLLSVGRLEEVKGVRFGLEATRILRDQGIDARYTVVGDGRLAGELRARATRLELDGSVVFTGALPSSEVAEAYAHHDLFLMPGVRTSDGQAETQGRVLLEAQAAGLPIVASRVGGIPETVAEGAGVLVPPGDATALAEAVAGLVRSPETWETMGRLGRRHVEAQYDEEVLLDRLLGIYEEVVPS